MLKREFSSSEKLFAIVLCLCLGFICNTFIIGLLYQYLQGEVAYKFLLILSSILTFGVPAVVASMFVGSERNPFASIGMARGAKAGRFVLVVVFMLAIMPAIELLSSLNASYSFPESMKGVEEYFRAADIRAMEATQRALSGNGIGFYILNLIALAITPAICEEMFFRGVLQKHLLGSIKNKHVAILLTAFIFSAIHLQFSGLLPRFILGAVLGYLFYSTGSLWISIVAHATNNAIVVSVAYFGDINATEIPDISTFANIWWIVAIVFGLAIAVFAGRKIFVRDGEA